MLADFLQWLTGSSARLKLLSSKADSFRMGLLLYMRLSTS
jgi:hypothetical protein